MWKRAAFLVVLVLLPSAAASSQAQAVNKAGASNACVAAGETLSGIA